MLRDTRMAVFEVRSSSDSQPTNHSCPRHEELSFVRRQRREVHDWTADWCTYFAEFSWVQTKIVDHGVDVVLHAQICSFLCSEERHPQMIQRSVRSQVVRWLAFEPNSKRFHELANVRVWSPTNQVINERLQKNFCLWVVKCTGFILSSYESLRLNPRVQRRLPSCRSAATSVYHLTIV